MSRTVADLLVGVLERLKRAFPRIRPQRLILAHHSDYALELQPWLLWMLAAYAGTSMSSSPNP